MRNKEACPLCGSENTFFRNAIRSCMQDHCGFIARYEQWEKVSNAMWRKNKELTAKKAAAKNCIVCGKHFEYTHDSREFCGEKCYLEHNEQAARIDDLQAQVKELEAVLEKIRNAVESERDVYIIEGLLKEVELEAKAGAETEAIEHVYGDSRITNKETVR